MLSIIVATDSNNLIGRDNSLPWHLPNDLKKFKDITSSGSKTMIMGRKTFESLKKVLPGRKHVILTRNANLHIQDENVVILHNVDELTPYINSKEEYYLIGGGEIFELLFPYVEKIYLTLVEGNFEGSVYLPNIDMNDWQIINEENGIVDEKNKYAHKFITLIKKKRG